MRHLLALAIALSALLVACGGGGSSMPSTGTIPTATAPSSPAKATGSATFAIFIPSARAMKKARPNYVSPNTQFAGITLTEEAGSPVPSPTPLVIGLTPGSPNCSASSSGTTCTISATYLVGLDAWTVGLYGPSGVTSTPLSINSIAQNIASGANAVNITLNPVVASLAFQPNTGACQSNDATCVQEVSLEALDATGAVIVGPGSYVNASQTPVTINLASAPSGVTLETSSGSAAATSATGPPQLNLAQVAYNGTGSAGAMTIDASDTNGDAASYTLNLTTPTPTPSPTPTTPASNGDIIHTAFSPSPIVNGTPGAFTPPFGDTSSGANGPLGNVADNGNETCEATMPDNYHIHVFIGIYVNGSWLALPEGLGIIGAGNPPPPFIIYATCYYFTHTHDQTGIFHVESLDTSGTLITQPIYETGDLFNIWGITVNAMQFGQFLGPVTVFTSGQVYRGGANCSGNIPPPGTTLGNDITPESALTVWTGDPNAIPLYSHEVIWFYVGSGNPTALPDVQFAEEC